MSTAIGDACVLPSVHEAGPSVPVPGMPNQSSEEDRIASILHQMDGMWQEVAHLRQAHLERTRVSVLEDERNEVESSLPDYASAPPDYASVIDTLDVGRNIARQSLS